MRLAEKLDWKGLITALLLLLLLLLLVHIMELMHSIIIIFLIKACSRNVTRKKM